MLPPVPTTIGELVSGDIMYLPGDDKEIQPYLVLDDNYSKLVSCSPIPNKFAPALLTAIITVKKNYARFHHELKRIRFDREPAMVSNASGPLPDAGIQVELTHGTHEHMAERMIRTLKDHFRTTLVSQPYLLPGRLRPALMEHVASSRNLLVNSSSSVSPFTMFTGCKPTNSRHNDLCFGDTVVCKIPYVDKDSELLPRGEICIVVGRDSFTPYAVKVQALLRDSKVSVTEN